MRSASCAFLFVAACSLTGAAPPYVPGGAALDRAARARYDEARRRDQGGDAARALAILGELCAAHPEHVGFHLYRLRLARRLDGPEAAASLYEPPPAGVDPELAAIFAKLARLPDDDIAGRQAVLEAATRRQPREPFWRLGVADVLLSSFEIVVMRAEEEQALGRVQDAATSFLEARRLLEEARQEAETALQYDAGFKEAQLLLGYLATRRADIAESRDEADEWRLVAESHYVAARDLDPACVVARLNLAENHLYFDQYRDATRELEIAARLAPGEPRVWTNLGLAAYSTGRIDDAIDAYRKALALEPRNARTRTALSDCLLRSGRPEKALAALLAARGDAGDDLVLRAEIAFKMAAIYERQRRYKDAVREYQRHIDLDGPDAAKAESLIRRIYEDAFE